VHTFLNRIIQPTFCRTTLVECTVERQNQCCKRSHVDVGASDNDGEFDGISVIDGPSLKEGDVDGNKVIDGSSENDGIAEGKFVAEGISESDGSAE
jgi:hypothetical protein